MKSFKSWFAAAAGTAFAAATPAAAQMPGMASPVPVQDDGTITTPAFELPFSSFASSEAKDEFVEQIREPANLSSDIDVVRKQAEDRVRPSLELMKRDFPYTASPSTMNGVPVISYVPEGGVSEENADRVLINVHGGAFMAGGGGVGGAIESVPIASVGKIRVVAVDYRLAPEHRFPAASEDLAAVYRELLKTHKPENIGIFGCSAGGMLTAQSIPWFLKERLPLPGAIGIFCASAYQFGLGDSAQLWPRMGSILKMIPPKHPQPEQFARDMPYFIGASPTDPLAVPAASKDVLKQFPPTLLLTGTRAPEMSGAVQTHLELTDLGVESQLLLFDGLDHGFFSNPVLPESRQAYRLIARFFAEHLGRK